LARKPSPILLLASCGGTARTNEGNRRVWGPGGAARCAGNRAR
jgi:hypothetical protein